MQLQQLRYFVAVAESRHFTQAATVTGVTQPSLSKQIHALEDSVRTPLFTRVRGNVELTAAGEALLPRARRILADVDTARLEIDELVGLRRGRLRLGATPSLCTSLVAPLLTRFRAAYPAVRLSIQQGGSQDLVASLARGQLDQAFIVLPDDGVDPALTAEPILSEPLVVASSFQRAEPLADGGPIPLARLRDEPMVMFRVGYDLREATLRACHEAGFEPVFAVEGGEMDAVLGFVEAGVGVALVPSMVVAGRAGLRVTPLAQRLRRTIAVAHRRDVTPTHTAAAMRGVLEDHLREAVAWRSLPDGVEVV
ncbi:MAG TPA: LysR substrate-binding domain-containing protein [Candidatus Limnocylindrales bacterium]|nr:LysR substrate-binding domain-containing protein [Candidatus Limnocylindrales bacterium]